MFFHDGVCRHYGQRTEYNDTLNSLMSAVLLTHVRKDRNRYAERTSVHLRERLISSVDRKCVELDWYLTPDYAIDEDEPGIKRKSILSPTVLFISKSSKPAMPVATSILASFRNQGWAIAVLALGEGDHQSAALSSLRFVIWHVTSRLHGDAPLFLFGDFGCSDCVLRLLAADDDGMDLDHRPRQPRAVLLLLNEERMSSDVGRRQASNERHVPLLLLRFGSIASEIAIVQVNPNWRVVHVNRPGLRGAERIETKRSQHQPAVAGEALTTEADWIARAGFQFFDAVNQLSAPRQSPVASTVEGFIRSRL